ncbi:MAG: hypothetical protein ABIF12_00130 [bacterium]
MKKIFNFILLTIFISQLNAWTHFTIKNDTNNTVEFSTNTTKKDLKINNTYNIINYNHAQNPIIKELKNKIIIGIDENWFKIGEKTPATDRTFTIAPKIEMRPGSQSTLKVSEIFKNNSLPEGFEYTTYQTGLILPEPEIATQPIIGVSFTPKFYIENDTPYPVTLFSCDSEDKIEIKPITKDKENKIISGDKFTVNPILYKNYKLKKGMVGLTKYRTVDENNMFLLNIRSENETHKLNIQVLGNCKPESTLKISRLIPTEGFKIESYKKINVKLQ